MEPNNIEKQFREKLNQREIKPSENSWDRLDAMLTVAEKPKRNYRWMYFAASFLGFILIATVFLSQTEEVIDVPNQEIVIEQNEIENSENTLEKVLENTPQSYPVQVVEITEKVVRNPQQSVKLKVTKLTKAAVAVNQKNSLPIIDEERSFDVQSNQEQNVTVDVSALLASVEQPRLSPPNPKNAVAVKVNTNDLLSQVDNELELSFREKVIQSVNKRYKEVKVAVTNRNLE